MLLPIILLTMIFSKNVRRGPLLINFVVTAIEVSIFSCLLLYAGVAYGKEDPPFGLCLAQASLLVGSSPAMNVAGLLIVHQMWSSLRAVTSGRELETERMTRVRVVSSVVVPHVFSLIFIIATAATGSRSPDMVTKSQSGFYCTIGGHVDDGSTVVSIILSLCTLILEVWTLLILYSKWSSNMLDMKLPHTTLAFNIRFIKRVVILDLFIMAAFFTSLLRQFNSMFAEVYHFSFCLVPLGVALVFGTQPSMLRVWCFWKPRKPRTEVDSYATTFSIVSNQRRGTILSVNRDSIYSNSKVPFGELVYRERL